MKSGYLYYASDKAVYDALVQRNFKNSDLRELFLSRGILIGDSERNDAAMYFSRLNHDYYDHQRIAAIFNVDSRKEKTTLTRVVNAFERNKLELVAQDLKAQLESNGASVRVAFVNERLEVKVTYEDYNSNKSEFKQTIERDALIEIESGESGLVIRHPNNRYISAAKDVLIDLLARNTEDEEEIQVAEIGLKAVPDNGLRTKFFKSLINGIDGYNVKDVTDVYVYNPKVATDDAEDLGIHITKASLKGEGVLSSPEMKSLFDSGFYISKIVWTVSSPNEQSDIYELEAQFSDAENCESFSYLVRGRYKYNESGHHNKHRVDCDQLSEKKLMRLIESGGELVLQAIKAEYSGASQ
ncbi:hypothetical protein AO741_20605 [Pseudomonas sp. TTU2014-105ASC]|nr:hypothetical protein AO741_20605 [Pseudomonas sp. TTU2014-105ASC]